MASGCELKEGLYLRDKEFDKLVKVVNRNIY